MVYIEREIKEAFERASGIYNIVAIVGARQAGKTTFLKEQMKGMNSSYVLFDDPDAKALFEEDIKKFERQYMEGFDTAVFDEVQYCKGAGTKLKYLADKGKKIWMTSSSEVILGKEILSYLVGRVSIIRLYPFSLAEFLTSKGQKEFTASILERNVWEHMTYGGYPKAAMADDIESKKMILKDLYDTMILKDAARAFSIEDVRALEEFSRYLSLNIGKQISYENISRDLKMSFQTLKKYMDALEKSYLIARVQPFYSNKTKEITKQPKIYFVDTGMRNNVARTFAAEPDGNLFENYVFSELLKMGFQPKYWRTKSKAEVDFVVEKNGKAVPIEAKLNAEPGRIEKSFRSFIEAYMPETALVVSYKGKKGEMIVNGCKIAFADALSMKQHLDNAFK